MRLLLIGLVLAILVLIPFAFWGADFAHWLSEDGAIQWIQQRGAWGWLAVIGLLIGDLFLPVPATPVMSAAGYVYGTFVGGLISATGSFCAGMLGYGLCRAFGHRIAVRLAGEQGLLENERLFNRNGPWLVAMSRWMPVLPEVIACLAGVTEMPVRVFAASLACGALPMGFVYAAIGAAGHQNPKLAIAVSVAVPPILWALSQRSLRSHDTG